MGIIKTVLIVDVDPEWRNRIEQAIIRDLGSEGFQCIKKTSLADANKSLLEEKRSFSVAVINISLDGNNPRNEDGFKLADILQQMSPRTEIVFLSEKLSIPQYKRINKRYKAAEALEKKPEENEFSVSELIRTVKEFSNKAEAVDVFVMMPLRDEYKVFYENIIQPFFENEKGYPKCRRADEFFEPRIIMHDILSYIQSADFSVADLSGKNNNVIFEVGIAHALEKNVILITRNSHHVPKILKPIRRITFSEDKANDLISQLNTSTNELQLKNYPSPFKRQELNTTFPGLCVILGSGESNNIKLFDIINPTLESKDLKWVTKIIIQETITLEESWKQIYRANLLIVDLTDSDPNIFYLAGFAYGLGKEIIFVSNDSENIPFDLADCSYIQLSDPEARANLDGMISLMLQAGRILLPRSPETQKFSNHSDLEQVAKIQVDVLLVTATEVETTAVLDWMGGWYKSLARAKNAYFDLGYIEDARIILLWCQKGTTGQGSSLAEILDGVDEVHPEYIISLGICFGVNPKKQKIGNVLIAHQILQYDIRRVGTTKDGKRDEYVRGDCPSASSFLINRFRVQGFDWKQSSKFEGLILSGDTLVDNLEERKKLCSFASEAIGGEMEGSGLYSAVDRRKKHWILVKGICDWADGRKRVNKQQRQALAAKNSASLVMHVLKKGGFKRNDP